MNYIVVTFPNDKKLYCYKTNLDLVVGGTYNIIADHCTDYSSPIKVKGYLKYKPNFPVREITKALLVDGPTRLDGDVKNIYINEEKGTVVVVWKNGLKTKVKCQPGDKFDAEKGIAMCFMKKAFDNRGRFNEVLKKYLREKYE